MSAGNDDFVIDDKTLFLLGNGPSLREIDLKMLAGRASLGMNAAYRYWREIGWAPTYYACLDTVVGLSHKEAIRDLIANAERLGIEQFLLRDNLIGALGPAAESERVINFDALRLTEPLLAAEPITTGSHAALWGAAMGFRQIALFGVDAAYVERVQGAEARGGIELQIVEDSANPNYFFDSYQRKGDRYNIPNPRPGLHVEAWDQAGAALGREGVRVVNANQASAVRVFPTLDGALLVRDGAAPVTAADRSPSPLDSPSGTAHPTLPAGFWRRQRRLILAGGVTAVIGAAAVSAIGRVAFDDFEVVAGAAAMFAIFMAVLFVRHSVSTNFESLARRVETLEVVIRDLQRSRRARRRRP